MEIDTASDEHPDVIHASIEKALAEAVGDGTVGNLKVDPDSVNVMEPKVRKAHQGMYKKVYFMIHFFKANSADPTQNIIHLHQLDVN